MEQILTNGKLADRNFAVIIDEAHTSQTGTAASKLQATLALRDAKAMEGLTVEELLEKIQSSRVRPNNVSYFAFTATPKHATLTLFGTRPDPGKPASKEDNLPVSFDKYPMRQAIEEGFILDVLQATCPTRRRSTWPSLRRTASAWRVRRPSGRWPSGSRSMPRTSPRRSSSSSSTSRPT